MLNIRCIFKAVNPYFCILSSLVLLTVISALIQSKFSSQFAANAESSNVTASVTVLNSCTMSGSIETNKAHSATVQSGSYTADIGETLVSVNCNDSNGYSVYAIGFTGDVDGTTTLVGANTSLTIPTGTSTSTTSSNWAMKLSAVSGTSAPTILSDTNGSFASYHVVPSTATKVATLTSNTESSSSFKTTYAVAISNSQPTDTYTGKVKYMLVHPATNVPNAEQATNANYIGYFPNAGNEVPDTMGDQTINASDTSAILWASNFKRDGYGFAGWSDKYDWELGANDADGNGTGVNAGYHIYGPNQTIEFTAGQYSTKGLSLYAVWVPSAGSFQNWTCPNNTVMPIGTVTALTDLRDNDTYAVAKLADGKCWMIENLRLDYDATRGTINETLSQGYGKSATYGNFIGLADPENANFDVANTTSSKTGPVAANSIYYAGTPTSTASVNILQDDYASDRIPRYNNNNTNSNSAINPYTTVGLMTDIDQNVYSYGNYYSWAAAKANTGLLNNLSKSEAAETSICPNGWKLPRGGDKYHESTNDFWALIVEAINSGNKPNNYNNMWAPYYLGTEETSSLDEKIMKFPNNYLYSGYIDGELGSIKGRGTDGHYWSASADSNYWGSYYGYYYAFYLVLNNSYNFPGTNNNRKNVGRAVRCVAQ